MASSRVAEEACNPTEQKQARMPPPAMMSIPDPFVKIKPSTTDNIPGLRSQIFANATTLFPQVALHSAAYHATGLVNPNDIFQIIIIGNGTTNKKHALLLFASHAARQIAARGPEREGVEEALKGLLDVLCESLGWYTETLLGELKNGQACAGGVVDFALVEGGFNFSAEERLAMNRV